MRALTKSSSFFRPTSGTMISGTTGRAGLPAGLDRRLEDGARLHLGDLGIGDGKPAAAMAEHRVELVQRLGALAAAFRPKPSWRAATSAISSSVFGRNSCSGGSSRRIVTGRPAMISNSSRKSERCIGSSLSSAARRSFSVSARIISRMATMRSPSKNMCSVRQSPMPSAPNERAMRASAGVSALVRTFMRRDLVGPFHDRGEIAGQFRLQHRHRALQHLAGAAVDGDDVALAQRRRPSPSACRCGSRRAASRRPKRRACPCRAPPPRRGWSCRRAWSGCLRRRACRGCPRGWSRCAPGSTLRPLPSSPRPRRRRTRSRRSPHPARPAGRRR